MPMVRSCGVGERASKMRRERQKLDILQNLSELQKVTLLQGQRPSRLREDVLCVVSIGFGRRRGRVLQ